LNPSTSTFRKLTLRIVSLFEVVWFGYAAELATASRITSMTGSGAVTNGV
jgi:hypothetical protein